MQPHLLYLFVTLDPGYKLQSMLHPSKPPSKDTRQGSGGFSAVSKNENGAEEQEVGESKVRIEHHSSHRHKGGTWLGEQYVDIVADSKVKSLTQHCKQTGHFF